MKNKLDVLFIGAHQDDIDATVGGTVALLADKGYAVEILDLSKRKNMYFQVEEDRANEAEMAAKILGVSRQVIDLGLLRIENNYANRVKVADYIRLRQPEIIVTLYKDETHPDHNAVHQLVLDAYHYSFATAIKTDNAPWRPKGIYFSPTNVLYEPTPASAVYIDISSTFERKLEALKCYASQMLFHINNRSILSYIEALNRSYGLLIKKQYAEVIIPRVPVIEPFPELLKKDTKNVEK